MNENLSPVGMPVIRISRKPTGRVTQWVVRVPPGFEPGQRSVSMGVHTRLEARAIALKFAADRFDNHCRISEPKE